MRVFTNERQRLEERRLSSSFDVLSGTLARQKTHPLYYNCDPSTVCVISSIKLKGNRDDCEWKDSRDSHANPAKGRTSCSSSSSRSSLGSFLRMNAVHETEGELSQDSAEHAELDDDIDKESRCRSRRSLSRPLWL